MTGDIQSSSSQESMLTSDQQLFMEQVARSNTISGFAPLLSGQKLALCEQLGLSEKDVNSWFAEWQSTVRKNSSRPAPTMQSRLQSRSQLRPKQSVDFSVPLTHLTRPLQQLVNTDVQSLSVYCVDLLKQVQKQEISPASYCAALSRVAARASIYLEDRDFVSCLGIIMALTEEFALAKKHLCDQFGLVAVFGRLLVRQAAHAILSTNWNVVEFAEDLANSVANVMGSAHIAFRGLELQKLADWETEQREQKDGKKEIYPGPDIEHLDVVARLAKNPWDEKFIQDILNGKELSPEEATEYASMEPPLITDIRLEILCHGKNYDAITQALNFANYHLDALHKLIRERNNGVIMCDEGEEEEKLSAREIRQREFDDYMEHRLKVASTQLNFKLQRWQKTVQLCTDSYGEDVAGMADILDMMIRASHTFRDAREPTLKLATHIVQVDWRRDAFHITPRVSRMWMCVLSEFAAEKMSEMVNAQLDNIQIITHARYLIDALSPLIEKKINFTGIHDPFVQQLVELGVSIAVKAWNLEEPECFKFKYSDKKKNARPVRIVMCFWLTRVFTRLGSPCHELGLLAALAAFCLNPTKESFTTIKKLHHTPQSRSGGPNISKTLHRELITLLSSVCTKEGLMCLHDPQLTWTKLTMGLLKIKCPIAIAIQIALEEKMYGYAIERVKPIIPFIIPPQLQSANGGGSRSQAASPAPASDGGSVPAPESVPARPAAAVAYESLQRMLADSEFVRDQPKFCYDAAHTLVRNIVRVGSGCANSSDPKTILPTAEGEPKRELTERLFHLVYDGVRVMCFVVNNIDHTRKYTNGSGQKAASQPSNISIELLYENLDSLKDLDGLPTDHEVLQKLWAGMAEVIQNSLGAQTTQQLLIQKKIITDNDRLY
eukprot:149789_1